jgi:hypothetical protein
MPAGNALCRTALSSTYNRDFLPTYLMIARVRAFPCLARIPRL